MNNEIFALKPIAHIRTDFKEKFGIPRQSGLVEELRAEIVFEPEFRHPEALRGIEGFDYLWLIWRFSANRHDDWHPTVRPPRLGGNARMGVFATRSPFRPNPLGLSSVRLIEVKHTETEGDILVVAGADLLDNTPIYDIKPYIPYSDSHEGARAGFANQKPPAPLKVKISDEVLKVIPPDKHAALKSVLAQDPRPAYQNDPERVYGLSFSRFDLHFKVENDVLTVLDIQKQKNAEG